MESNRDYPGTTQFVEQGVYVPPPTKLTIREQTHRFLVFAFREADALQEGLRLLGSTIGDVSKIVVSPANKGMLERMSQSPDFNTIPGAEFYDPKVQQGGRLYVVEVETSFSQDFRAPQPEAANGDGTQQPTGQAGVA